MVYQGCCVVQAPAPSVVAPAPPPWRHDVSGTATQTSPGLLSKAPGPPPISTACNLLAYPGAPQVHTMTAASGHMAAAATVGGQAVDGTSYVNRMSVEEYRSRLHRIYAVLNPEKVSQLDYLLTKYRGQEEFLYQSVCLKYKIYPECAAVPFAKSPPVAAACIRQPVPEPAQQGATVSRPADDEPPAKKNRQEILEYDPATGELITTSIDLEDMAEVLGADFKSASKPLIDEAPTPVVIQSDLAAWLKRPPAQITSSNQFGEEVEEDEYDPFSTKPEEVPGKSKDELQLVLQYDYLLLGERTGFFEATLGIRPAVDFAVLIKGIQEGNGVAATKIAVEEPRATKTVNIDPAALAKVPPAAEPATTIREVSPRRESTPSAEVAAEIPVTPAVSSAATPCVVPVTSAKSAGQEILSPARDPRTHGGSLDQKPTATQDGSSANVEDSGQLNSAATDISANIDAGGGLEEADADDDDDDDDDVLMAAFLRASKASNDAVVPLPVYPVTEVSSGMGVWQ